MGEGVLLAERLHARSPEICQAILARLNGLEEESPTLDIEYLRGLEEAVRRGVEYGVALLAGGERDDLHFPIPLVGQSRLAARQRIPLEMVIWRYVAAKDLFSDFLLEESLALGGQDPLVLQAALATQRTAFDQLLAVVREEYKREELSPPASDEARSFRRVRRLLAGERVDPSPLNYPFDRHHLGVIAGSPEAGQVIRRLATATDTRLLKVRSPGGEVWAWLGSDEPLELEPMRRIAASVCSSPTPVGLGALSRDLRGWRLTHKQARLALGLAQVGRQGPVHYADVPLVASAAQDPQLRASLQELYLLPLNRERDGGARLRKTLRAYFSANRNGKSAGAALGVTRQTVTNHLGQVEDRLGQPLSVCADAVDVALRLEELGILEQKVDNL